MPIPCGTTSRRSSRGAGRVRPRPTWRSACHPYESGNRRDAAIAVRSGYLVRGVRPDHRDFLARSGDRRHRGARRQEPRMSRTALGVAAVPQPAGSRAGGGRAPVSRGADPRAAVHAPVAPVRRPARGAERDHVPLRTAASGHQVRRVDRTDAGHARRPDPPPTAASSEPPSRTCRSTPCATWRASWSASPPSSWATAAWRNCGTSPSARAVPGTRRRRDRPRPGARQAALDRHDASHHRSLPRWFSRVCEGSTAPCLSYVSTRGVSRPANSFMGSVTSRHVAWRMYLRYSALTACEQARKGQ